MVIWICILTVISGILTIIFASTGKYHKQRDAYKEKHYAVTEETLVKMTVDYDRTQTYMKWEYEVNGKKYHHREFVSGSWDGIHYEGQKRSVYYKKSNPKKLYEKNAQGISYLICILFLIFIVIASYCLNLIFPLGDNGIFDGLK